MNLQVKSNGFHTVENILQMKMTRCVLIALQRACSVNPAIVCRNQTPSYQIQIHLRTCQHQTRYKIMVCRTRARCRCYEHTGVHEAAALYVLLGWRASTNMYKDWKGCIRIGKAHHAAAMVFPKVSCVRVAQGSGSVLQIRKRAARDCVRK